MTHQHVDDAPSHDPRRGGDTSRRTRLADLWAQANVLGCACLVDAMGRLHQHRAHLPPLVSPDPTMTLFGQALTMAYLPYRDDVVPPREFKDVFHEAIAGGPVDGRVLVLSSGGYPDISHAGGTKLSRVANHHLAGVLADGRLRDFSDLGTQTFSTWCRGEAVRWAGDTVMPHRANVAVEIAGVCVNPGDYIYVEPAGGVVIPAQSVDAVFAMAHEVADEDRRALVTIVNEAPAR